MQTEPLFESRSPWEGVLWEQWPAHTPAQLEQRLARARGAQRTWAAASPAERAAGLRSFAASLRARREVGARLAAQEMGKPLAEGRGELEKCATALEFFAQQAGAWLADEELATEARQSLVSREPLGLVLAVMPWNFPFWQVLRCAAPALAAGNGILLKHAPNTQACAEELERAANESGLPVGLLTNLRVDHAGVAALLEDQRVAALSFTGSARAGRRLAALAGGAAKPSLLELGGSDPLVVLADADLARAAQVAAHSRLLNAGQSCIAAKRWIVERSVLPEFKELVLREFADWAAAQGDPLAPGTRLGPLAREDLRQTLAEQVERSRARGARVCCGGAPLAGSGWFYPPTLLESDDPRLALAREESFGPAALLIGAQDEPQALELADATSFGLGASLWTTPERGARLARHIEAGTVFVNALVRSDPRLPFGGRKLSGYGRELGRVGLEAFVAHKSVWVE